MYVVTPIIGPRRVFRDTTLEGYSIPKNTTILVNLYSVNMDPDLHPNPHEFKPERFLKDDSYQPNKNLVLFGKGKTTTNSFLYLNDYFRFIFSSISIHTANAQWYIALNRLKFLNFSIRKQTMPRRKFGQIRSFPTFRWYYAKIRATSCTRPRALRRRSNSRSNDRTEILRGDGCTAMRNLYLITWTLFLFSLKIVTNLVIYFYPTRWFPMLTYDNIGIQLTFEISIYT